MARRTQVSEKELQNAQKLRDEATTATELRKAMSVILRAELGLDADRTAELLGASRSTIFRDRNKFSNESKYFEKIMGRASPILFIP